MQVVDLTDEHKPLYFLCLEDTVSPTWIREKRKPEKIPGQVTVTAFLNGWCPGQNLVFERAKRAAAEFGVKVMFNEINTFDRNIFLEW